MTIAVTIVVYRRSVILGLEHTTLLKLVVDRDGQDTSGNLRYDVGCGVVARDAAIVEGHDGHSGVEVAAGDGAAQERQNGQGRADRPGIARGNDYRQEDERAQEFDEDGQKIHRGSTSGVVFGIANGRC